LSLLLFVEKSKYLEYFLIWYHLIQANTSASRTTTVKIPPKNARATEELEEPLDNPRQLVGGIGMVVSVVLLVLVLVSVLLVLVMLVLVLGVLVLVVLVLVVLVLVLLVLVLVLVVLVLVLMV